MGLQSFFEGLGKVFVFGVTAVFAIVVAKRMTENSKKSKENDMVVKEEPKVQQAKKECDDAKTTAENSIANRHEETSIILRETLANTTEKEDTNTETVSENNKDFDDVLSKLDKLSE